MAIGSGPRRHIRVVDQTALPGLEPDPAPLPSVTLPLKRRALTVQDVDRWASSQRTWIAAGHRVDEAAELEVYLQAAKLVEEVGELHAQLLGRSRRQRPEKTARFGELELEAELADVVLSAAVLASILGVDLKKALAEKMALVEQRRRRAETAQ